MNQKEINSRSGKNQEKIPFKVYTRGDKVSTKSRDSYNRIDVLFKDDLKKMTKSNISLLIDFLLVAACISDKLPRCFIIYCKD